ncbi:MAG TPA: cytochrome c oxidase accessory protein CcoG [Burkholderiales bacterium]|nr:cytochrome c oxidase accessory protein CcoG [Burkholderiales bacterium]
MQAPIKLVTAADAAPNGATESADQALYEVRKKIYPRAVHGKFALWRWAFVLLTQLVFYGTPWLTWNGRQAVLFDLAARKFYIFGLVFWPQDVIYLTVLLIISAYSLFLFTAVAGRLWCGFACPQTVYTEMFLWIERKIEGERLARMKLDKQPLTARKLGLKAAKHGVWIALSLWTGFTFVGFFTPIQSLGREVLAFGTGPWETFWILFYGFATYGNAGWMREQVCKYMCPYARFQSVMFDQDTLIITYDRERGEQRGARNRSVDYKAKGLGDCVDCGICVQVCPTGIDIRNGLQYECIGCAACIDGCNQVMDKMGYPQGLIRYSTENAMQRHSSAETIVKRVFRPRVLVYSAVLWLIILAAAITLYHRVPLKVDVIRDRGNVMHDADEADAQNVYRLQIMNTQEVEREVRIRVSGLDGIELEGLQQPIRIGPASSRVVPVRVEAPRASGAKGSHRIQFTVVAADPAQPAAQPLEVVEKATFVIP